MCPCLTDSISPGRRQEQRAQSVLNSRDPRAMQSTWQLRSAHSSFIWATHASSCSGGSGGGQWALLGGGERARVSSCDAPRHPSGDQASQPARHGGQIGQITLQRRAPARTELCTGSKFEGQVKMTVHASSMKSCSVICPICDVAEKLGHSWSINGGTSCTNQGGRVSWCMRGADSQAQAHAPRSF